MKKRKEKCRKVEEVRENHHTPIVGDAFIYIESCTSTRRTIR